MLITPEIIRAVRTRTSEEQAIAISKIAEDVAIQNLVDEALLLRHILIAGSQTKPVHNLKPALTTIYRTINQLDQDIKELKLIICHIGNGASLCAVDGGRSIDTSMGFTPLAGIAMGTRSGDIDPAIVQFIAEKEHKTLDEVIHVLNYQSMTT